MLDVVTFYIMLYEVMFMIKEGMGADCYVDI